MSLQGKVQPLTSLNCAQVSSGHMEVSEMEKHYVCAVEAAEEKC